MDTLERRALIDVLDNPETRLDYLVVLAHDVDAGEIGHACIVLRYVPDRFTVEAASWRAYLAAFAAKPATSLELLAATILSDVNDVAIARWMEISATVKDGFGGSHTVVLTDSQPGWKNDDLMGRMVRLGDATT